MRTEGPHVTDPGCTDGDALTDAHFIKSRVPAGDTQSAIPDARRWFYEIAQTTLGCLRCSPLPRPPLAQRVLGPSRPVPGGRVCDELAATARQPKGAAPPGSVTGGRSAESALAE